MPAALGEAVAAEVAAAPPGELRSAVERLSARYRESVAAPRLRPLDAWERIAYLAVRMPATHAVAARVLGEVAAGTDLAGSEPLSLLDLGAGPGTVLHAASVAFGRLARATMVERDAGFIALGRRLSARLAIDASWIEGDWTAMPAGLSFDLVTASFVLGEIPPASRRALVERAWAATGLLLVLVEPGTPDGAARIGDARRRLVEMGASLLAPCPHEASCPLAAPDWCHFAARLARTRTHRLLKGADLPYEDEKYSFLVAARRAESVRDSRILRRPLFGRHQVRLRLCTPSGLADRLVYKSERAVYRAARSAAWGDRWRD